MNPQQNNAPDPNQPVAYDAEGRPLFAAPQVAPAQPVDQQYQRPSHVTATPDQTAGQNYDPQLRVQYANEPNVVHATRPLEPEQPVLSDEVKQKHDNSVRMYPTLNLSPGEYVLLSIKRHPIGLFIPMGVSIGMIILLVAAMISYPLVVQNSIGDAPGAGLVAVICMVLIVLAGLGGYLAVWVYLRNTFYLTNESVIQELQYSIFSKHEQTVSLGSVEDASYIQKGIFPTLLNYGEIRLSTEGEETTYRFQYVDNPKEQVAHLSNAVESFKNGRPVDIMHDN